MTQPNPATPPPHHPSLVDVPKGVDVWEYGLRSMNAVNLAEKNDRFWEHTTRISLDVPKRVYV